MTPETLIEAVRYFSDLEICNEYMRKIKWPSGKPVCPHCGAKGDRLRELDTRPIIRCKDCRKDISYKVGTIFEGSRVPLKVWFVAIFASANYESITSVQLAKLTGTTQKTAWRVFCIIRQARSFIKYRVIENYRLYRVGNDGSVWSRRWKVGNCWETRDDWQQLWPTVHKDDYRYVTLHKEGKSRSRKVSVLVAQAFHGVGPKGTECCHRNGVRSDDRARNLRWGTRKANAADRDAHGRTAHGERNGSAKLTAMQVKAIRTLDGRMSHEKIGKTFGVSQVHVSRIIRREARNVA